jgi:hypothetical protein
MSSVNPRGMDEWLWRIGGSCDREIKKLLGGKTLSQCHCVHHKSYMDCFVVDPKPFL